MTAVALALVWAGASPATPGELAALGAWADVHRYALVAPGPSERPPMGHDDELAGSCERRLAEARDLLAAREDDEARSTLASVEQTLRDHPELPESAFIMAERLRMLAVADARAAGRETIAASLVARADALEGGRATTFGETPRARTEPTRIDVSIVVHGARRAVIVWDGVPRSGTFATSAGEHHLLVLRGDRLVYAGWIAASAPGPIDVYAPDAPACSAEDLEGAALGDAATAPADVRCGAWAIAGPSAGGSNDAVLVATCKRARCDAPIEWRAHRDDPSMPPPPIVVERWRWPAWATWTLAGAGAALATGAVLWRTGAFTTRGETTTSTTYDGSALAR